MDDEGNPETTTTQWTEICYTIFWTGGAGGSAQGTWPEDVFGGGGHYNPNRQKNVSSTESNDCADIEDNIYEILAVVLIRIEEYLKWADGKYNQAVRERQTQLRKLIARFDNLNCSSNNPRMRDAREVAERPIPLFRKIPELNYVRPWVGPIPVLVPRMILPTPMICIICSPEVIKKALETIPGGGGFPDA